MWNMILGNSLLLLNLTYLCNNMLKRRYKNKYVIPAAILLGVLVLASRSYPSLQLYGTFIMIGYYILFAMFLYTGKFLKKLTTIIIYLMIATVCEVLASNIMNLLFDLQSSDLNTLIYSIALLLSGTLTFAVLSIAVKLFNLNMKSHLPKYTWLILILPFSTFLLIFSISDYFETFRNNLMIAPVLIGLLIANFVTLYIFFKTIRTIELENEMKSMQVKYETINMLYQNNFNFLHDTTRKLMRLSSFLSNKNYDELSKQINELSDTMLVQYNTINSNSVIISSILNYRLNDIISNNIRIKTDILCNDFSFLSIKAQNELFSALVNNAVDSCIYTKSESPAVIIKSNVLDHNVVIQCFYSYNEKYESENNYNIELIQKHIHEFDGIISSQFNNKGYCDLTIILPNVK